MTTDGDRRSNRRRFLQGAGTLAAAGLTSCAKPTPPAAPPAAPNAPVPPAPAAAAGAIQRRKLGRTGLDVSVIGFGAGGLSGPHLMRKGIGLGINYIDTAMCYGGGRSEGTVGQAIRGIRDQVVLATKWDVFPEHSKADCLAMLDGSLQRLGVDHVDVLFLHQVGDHPGHRDNGHDRLENDGLYEAIEQARTDGKARFFGVSSHVGNRAELLRKAIDKGVFDVILVSLAYGNFDGTGVPELLAYAAEKNVGVVGMKVSQGNQSPPELASAGLNLFQAQLRWALEQGCATVINGRISNSDQDQAAAIAMAQGELKVTRADVDLLRRYTLLTSADYCRGCGHLCQGACPAGVRIADILRYRMYYKHYGDQDQAIMRYAALEPGERLTAMCGECNACTAACPHGLPVVEQLYEAQRLLLA